MMSKILKRNVFICSFTLAAISSLAPWIASASQGKFKVLPADTKTNEMKASAKEWMDSGAMQELASMLNEIFILPADIGMRFSECGEANAYYSPDERTIDMCMELIDDLYATLEPQYDEKDLDDAVAEAFISVALHEVGHALVDVLELPITGREEDAVDQLSAWMLIQAEEPDSVLSSASSYYLEDEDAPDDSYFADEHSLNRQRYFNLVCWVYGSDPENSEHLITDWELPEERAEGCEAEYMQLDKSWSRLLGDHIRE